ELAGALVEPPPAGDVPVEQARRLMFAAVARFLTNVAGPSGTLLALDNLQWAQPPALDLLAAIMRAGVPTLRVLGAYEEGERTPDSALSTVLADLTHAGLAVGHRLPRLSPAEGAELLDVALAALPPNLPRADALDPAWREEALRRAAGVPALLLDS